MQGKGYDGETGTGRELWAEVEQRLRLQPLTKLPEETAALAAIESHGFGKTRIILPRLGQGSFRIVVTDAYERRCGLSGERTLSVLDAAHIKPYVVLQRHEVSNGILMPVTYIACSTMGTSLSIQLTGRSRSAAGYARISTMARSITSYMGNVYGSLSWDTRVVELELAWPQIVSTPLAFTSVRTVPGSRDRRSTSGRSISATPSSLIGELERYFLLVPVYKQCKAPGNHRGSSSRIVLRWRPFRP